MKIYIDADRCPVVRNTLKIAKKYGIACVILCDTAHHIEHEGAATGVGAGVSPVQCIFRGQEHSLTAVEESVPS